MKMRFWTAIASGALAIAAGVLVVPTANAATSGGEPAQVNDGRPQPPPAPPRIVGAVQICKTALSPGVTGEFQFRIRGGVPNQVTVEVGRCSAVIGVIVDEVAIAELPKAGVQVRSITVRPPDRGGHQYLPEGQVIVKAGERGDPTVVVFGNVAGR